ncbi:FHA domain-containing protein [Actinomyces trachealis]|uniref:FHA domain-containing protein n=1 Tax=Actinomyces trachealis TaxID=2763540 RepID=UPI001892A843|nr:FHA domain-containing protein [Actinomyces trachealis]
MSTGLTSAGAVQWVGGSWVAAVTPRGVMLLPPTADDAVVTDLWELLRAEGTSMVDLMDALLGNSGGHIGSLPEFAAVLSGEAEAMHVMVRGRPVVFVDGTKLNCDGVETWYETTLESGRDVRVIAPEELHGRTRPVVDAIVSAAALLLGGGKIEGDIIPKAPEPAALAAAPEAAAAKPETAEAEQPEAEVSEGSEVSSTAAPQVKDAFLDAPLPAPALVEESVPAPDETMMAPRIDIEAEAQATEVVEDFQSADSADRVVDSEPLEVVLTGDQIDEVDELSTLTADAEQAESPTEATAESGESSESASSADEAEEPEDKKAEAYKTGDLADDAEAEAEDADGKVETSDERAEVAETKAAAAAQLVDESAKTEAPEAEVAATDEPPRGRGRFGKRMKAAAAAAAAAAGLVAHDSAEAEDLAEATAEEAEAKAKAAVIEDHAESEQAETQEAEAEEAETAEIAEAGVQAEETAVLPVRDTPIGQFPDDEIEYELELEPGAAVVDDFDEGEVRVVTPAAAKPAQKSKSAQEPQDADEGRDGDAVSSTIISHTVDQDLPQALLAELDAEFGVDLDSPSTNELYEDRYVLACPCPKGHANPTSRSKCRICGEDLVLPAQRMVCPALGTVTMSSGEVISLDRDLVVGRQPDVTSFAMGDVPPLAVVVPSPERLISRNHVHIMLEEWAVLVEDLATRNGTILCRDGEDPVRMAPGTSVLIRNGDELVLGDGQSLVFEDLP